MKTYLQIERAISELKRGEMIVVNDYESHTSVLLSAAEMIDKNTLKDHLSLGFSSPNLILSASRCNALGYQTKENCSLIINSTWIKEDILNFVFSKKENLKLNFDTLIPEKNEVYKCCLDILKKAELLPTAIVTLISDIDIENIDTWSKKNNLIYIDTKDFKNQLHNSINDLEIVAKSHLPIKYTNDCDFIVFRSKNSFYEYFCLLFGIARKLQKKAKIDFVPTVRIHSQCLTGDLLASLKCDCGEQLNKSLEMLAKNGEGILIYLSQEGRNIGLTNKLRSYNLQEQGLDTVDANLTLGFEEDERTYSPAKHILDILNINKINLITNNPDKIKQLENLGISIMKRIPLLVKSNKFNKNYLNTKKNKSEHYL